MGAGTKGVVASLWEVESAKTSRLMTNYYSAMFNDTHPAAALRNA